MKKKNLLVLLFALVCVLTVGCGKDDGEEKESSKKESSNVAVLTCSREAGDTKLSTTIKQDKKTNKLTEMTMTMEESTEEFADMNASEADLEKMICEDENEEYKSCSVKFEGKKVIANMSFDMEKYEKEIIEEEEEIDKIDADTLNKLKTSGEKDGFTCTLK